jgi:septal ring factor EnvC (AmiA/AmiB activator)
MITSPQSTSSPVLLTNPKLTATLRADYEALQNDVLQANEMAADFQRQLAGKSNEFAELKQLFEKTQNDLVQFQENVLELRKERHRLANEALRTLAYEIRLKDMTVERDRLQSELDAVRHGLAGEVHEAGHGSHARTAQVAKLILEMETLKQPLAPSNSAPGIIARPTANPEVAAALGQLGLAVARLQAALDAKPGPERP